MWAQSLRREDALEEGTAPAPAFLPGERHGPGSLVGHSPWDDEESGVTGRLSALWHSVLRGKTLHCTKLLQTRGRSWLYFDPQKC